MDVKKRLSLILLQQVPRKYGTELAIQSIRLQKKNLQNITFHAREKEPVQLKKSDYDKYDLFLCMDSRNVTNTMRIFGGDPNHKVCKLLKNKDVSDPWYTDRFDVAYNDILEGCRQLLEGL